MTPEAEAQLQRTPETFSRLALIAAQIAAQGYVEVEPRFLRLLQDHDCLSPDATVLTMSGFCNYLSEGVLPTLTCLAELHQMDNLLTQVHEYIEGAS